MTTVNPISSSCKLCLFAKYDGNTQIGCEFNRTEKIDNHPLYELIEAYDDEKNFFVLNNHICPYQRTHHWIHADSPNKKELVEKEVYMRWGAIVLGHKQEISTIQQRLEELYSQSIKPSIIILVLDNYILIEQIFKMMDKYSGIWYLQNNLDEDLDDRFNINLCFEKMKRHKFMFYATFEVDKPINPHFYERIHKYVIDDMNQYGVIKNGDSLHEMVVNKIVHSKYSGNSSNVNLEDKVIADNHEHFIIDYNSL